MYTDWEGRNKTSVLAHDMNVYVENPKESTKSILELISDFSKVIVYKINI